MGDGIKGLFRSINRAPVRFPASVLLHRNMLLLSGSNGVV